MTTEGTAVTVRAATTPREGEDEDHRRCSGELGGPLPGGGGGTGIDDVLHGVLLGPVPAVAPAESPHGVV